ncbi:S-layer homology domain-containing protein [uncultured Megasphaera sp.]|uniref:S-layer homology domain-containing protein n=1 Tax=uncultured Megasphaera sp. TaxID=165188 RepID=UPI002599BADF|nr:S-layer homology domain-containing protein [uncultured Megasphaera sp.]
MKKTKILAALAATMAVGATCAFAANPFADVPADSWAYKSVVTLANSGILQGVDGTHFQGNRNITRYEAAEITAKAMAHADRANAQQRAVINKLAHEFAGELNNLGVRVANLEDQVGTVKFSGSFQVDYKHKADSKQGDAVVTAGTKGDASYSYTAKLKATAKVSENVKANLGFKYKGEFKSVDPVDGDHASAWVNVANVQAKVADQVSVLAGRHDLTLGQGYIYDDVVDGVEAQVAADKVSVQGGYAKLKADASYKVGYVQAQAAVCDYATVGAYFANVVGVKKQPDAQKNMSVQVYGASVQAKVADQVKALVSYEKYKVYDTEKNQTTSKPASWYGKVTYGKADFATPKSWDVWVDYLNADKFDFVNGGTWRGGDLKSNVKSWGIGVDYTFAKNAKLQFKQSFASKVKKEANDTVKTKLGEQTKAQLVFVF